MSEQDFQDEWQRLGDYLKEHGGLEAAVRRAYEVMDPVATRKNQRAGLQAATQRITLAVNRSRSGPAKQ